MSVLKYKIKQYFKEYYFQDLKTSPRASEVFAGMIAIISSTIPKGIKAEINLLSKGTGLG